MPIGAEVDLGNYNKVTMDVEYSYKLKASVYSEQ